MERGQGLALRASWGGRPGAGTVGSEQLTLPCLWAEAGVGAQPIQTGGPVLTLVPDTVVWIHLTVQACEPCQDRGISHRACPKGVGCRRAPGGFTWGTEAEMKGGVPLWHQLAGASIETAPGRAGPLPELALGTFLPHRAEALEGAQGVMAGGAPRAGTGLQEALVDVAFTGVTLEARWTAALDLGVCGQAHASVGTGVGGAEVSELALLTCSRARVGGAGRLQALPGSSSCTSALCVQELCLGFLSPARFSRPFTLALHGLS